jgi:nicotinamide-nucleotide amidase
MTAANADHPTGVDALFPPDLAARAAALLDRCRAAGLKIATAESCTGGLVIGLLTEIPGSSAVVERGFVVYSNEAKQDLLGVPPETLAKHGAVSEATARAMAEGALDNSRANLAVSVTGVAGPDGGTAEKPVGLVWFACARRGAATLTCECRFGELGRAGIRLASVRVALDRLEIAASRKAGSPVAP